jgi:Ser/Thr protein kinase RdoA (MazF antagonist)
MKYSANALDFAVKCYGFENCSVSDINSGSNKVYKIDKKGQNYYLRISIRDYEYILAEIDWLMFFEDSVKVPRLYKSINNKIIETFHEDGKTYAICAFYELPGVIWDKNNAAAWNETVIYNWGNTMGKMHRLTKNYRPQNASLKRKDFADDLVPLEIYKDIPSVYNKMARLQNEILLLPRDIDSYGLIHSDMDQYNMLIDNNEISLLDFDDCQYGFYALDIGIALYHAMWWGLPDGGDCHARNGFALKIIDRFMSGYNAENNLSQFWLKKIMLFMLYRQIAALSWHLSYYKPRSIYEIVYNDLFHIYYDFGEHVKFIENDIFYDGCTIDDNAFAGAASGSRQ